MPYYKKNQRKEQEKREPKSKAYGCPRRKRGRVLLCLLFLTELLLAGCAKESDIIWSTETETMAEEPGGTIESQEASNDTGEELSACVIHICGAVADPGVYELPAGSRIRDAVLAAGGFLEEASESALNLAAFVTDGQQIIVWTKEEAAADQMGREAERETGSGLVNINQADSSQLCTLPGIGESRAAAIIAYREAGGPFGSIEDIMKVDGIKEASFEKLKDRITV